MHKPHTPPQPVRFLAKLARRARKLAFLLFWWLAHLSFVVGAGALVLTPAWHALHWRKYGEWPSSTLRDVLTPPAPTGRAWVDELMGWLFGLPPTIAIFCVGFTASVAFLIIAIVFQRDGERYNWTG